MQLTEVVGSYTPLSGPMSKNGADLPERLSSQCAVLAEEAAVRTPLLGFSDVANIDRTFESLSLPGQVYLALTLLPGPTSIYIYMFEIFPNV